MDLKIQIVPVGFEYERVLIGEKYYPSNLYYLLESTTKNIDYKGDIEKKQLDKKLVELSKTFIQKIKNQLKNHNFKEVVIRECSFIKFDLLLHDLCEIFREIFLLEDEDNTISEIYVNTSTSTKLFSSAIMYLSTFFTNKIKLFYVSSGNYTTNLLLTTIKKAEIKKKFVEYGMTYQSEEKGYSLEEIPVVPSILPKEKSIKILKILHSLQHLENTGEWISLVNLLEKLGENIYDRDKSKSIRMKYRSNIVKLIKRKLISEKLAHKKRYYKLTNEGKVYSTIIANLYEFMKQEEKN